jgi:ferric-dicitrate binding protein FerR (iron transport regulator)
MPDSNEINVELKALILKYVENTCSREELSRMLQMIEKNKNTDGITQILKDYWEKSKPLNSSESIDLDEKFGFLMKEAKHQTPVVSIGKFERRGRLNIRYAAAVIIFCIFSMGVYFLVKPKNIKQISKTENRPNNDDQNDIAPGKNVAVLTLADGSSIILDSSHNGTLATQGNSRILKLNGMISYNNLNKSNAPVLYNTVSTPRGGTYLLLLTDGTKVWLNAASSLRFPATFVGRERKVELVGEAYFEVAKNTRMPFKVEVKGMEVEVLGTHFNINSYEDESSIRTTLLEGSIKINKNNNTSLLKPGQQAELKKNGSIKIINHADLEEAIAWKEGKFQFDRADIHTVMRQIARWYNVEVDYKGTVSSHFGGTISRNVNLSQVLNMLHLTGEVKFKVKDQKVLVMP